MGRLMDGEQSENLGLQNTTSTDIKKVVNHLTNRLNPTKLATGLENLLGKASDGPCKSTWQGKRGVQIPGGGHSRLCRIAGRLRT